MSRNGITVLAAVVALLSCRAVQAAPLRIDFTSNAAGPTQALFSPFQHGINNSLTTTAGEFPYANDELAGIGNDVTVNVMGSYWRVRSAISSGPHLALNDLLRDGVGMVSAGGQQTITLTLSGLKPGIFQMTTYHHDTQFGGGNARMEFLLTDGLGVDQSIATGIATTGTTSPSVISTHTFDFTVLDDSPVILKLVGTDFNVSPLPADMASLNGFELSFVSDLPPVPEPASGLMISLGAFLGLLRIQKCRQQNQR